MSTLTSNITPSVGQRLPPLQNGDRLNRVEFERRFDATPGLKNAELIEGIVHMPPPVSHADHSRPNASIITWMTYYCSSTPGTDSGTNGSLRLDLDNMPQPDAYLMIREKSGGQSQISSDGYVVGAPELVCEVAASTVSFDLHAKRNLYRRAGVREYIVWRTYDREIDYFILRDGDFARLAPVSTEPAVVYHSEVFPGLWLDASAMLRGDLKSVLDQLQQGSASPEHDAFVEQMTARSTRPLT